MKLVVLSFWEKQLERRCCFVMYKWERLLIPQLGGSFEVMQNMNPGEQWKLRASRVSSILKVKHYCLTAAKHFKKETKLGESVVIIPTRSKGSCFLFFLNKLDSIFESEFFDKMRASSLRLAVNREKCTWLNHSRFLTSLSTCIHESFTENYFYTSYMWALEKCMSFINSARNLSYQISFWKLSKIMIMHTSVLNLVPEHRM